MTATINEIELTELIDFESTVPCCQSECDNEGTWICRSSCRVEGIHCAPHRQQWLNTANSHPFVNCNHCHEGVFIDWRQHFSWRLA